MLALVAIGVGLPLVLGGISGALVVAQNDDWTYRRIAQILFETGQVHLFGLAMLLGQVLVVQPFLWVANGDAWAFAAATASFAVVGIVAGYLLVRRLLPFPRAMVALLSLVFVPGFLLYSTSFMTDVPALSAESLCLCLGAVALARSGSSRWRWLIASLVAGFFAFTIREFALAAPVAVLIAAAAAGMGRARSFWVAGFVAIAACGVMYLVFAQKPDVGTAQASSAESLFLANRTRFGIATLALTLSPSLVIALASWWRRWRLLDLAGGAIVGAWMFGDVVGTLVRGEGIPWVLIGNVLEPTGTLGDQLMAGGRPFLYPPQAWDVLNAIALVSTIIAFGIVGAALGAIVRHPASITRTRLSAGLGSTAGLLATFSVLYGAGLVAFGLIFGMLDRYQWPLAVPLSALLLIRPDVTVSPVARRPAYGVAGAIMLILAATSLVLLLNRDAFDAARWRMADAAVALGIPAENVDAGFEWVGYHLPGIAGLNWTATPGPYYRWFPFHACAVVSSSLLDQPGFRLEKIDTEAYRLLLFDGWQYPLYLYRVSAPGCP